MRHGVLAVALDLLDGGAELIAREHLVLAALREHDRELLPTIFMPSAAQQVIGDDDLKVEVAAIWQQSGEVLKHRLGEAAPIAFIWLVGQALAPLSKESIKSQVERMLPRTLF